MPLVLVSSPRFVDHVTPAGHPERPERAETMAAVAARFAEQGGTVLEPRLATDDDLARVHTPEHIESIGPDDGLDGPRGPAEVVQPGAVWPDATDLDRVRRVAGGGSD